MTTPHDLKGEGKKPFYPKGFWNIWPLAMALCFVLMQQPRDTKTFVLKALSAVFLSYSLTLRVMKYCTDGKGDR
jgi:hypothetical protein